MMHVSQEQLRAAEVRRRLMGKSRGAVNIYRKPVPVQIEPPVVDELPPPPPPKKVAQKETRTFYPPPLWKMVEISFNQHVVDYYEGKASEERNDENGILVRPRTWQQITADVLEAFDGVTMAELIGPTRTRAIVAARHMAWYQIRAQLGLSLPQIAMRFGNRDHTTVLSGIRVVEKKLGVKVCDLTIKREE